MRTIVLLWVLMVAVLVALSCAAPRAGAFTSPELTPPFRPTPTGWPNAPFPWETPAPSAAGGGGGQRIYLPMMEMRSAR